MSEKRKNQRAILDKLGIEELNNMQREAHAAIFSSEEVVLLSPTGTGKTLAFLLPVVAELDPACKEVQVLILVPSRELAIQIEQVMREMGSGYKVNAVYGGQAGFKDRSNLKHTPAILIGTPGRVADHFRRERIVTDSIRALVLDEFDKSLETGFEGEMKEIMESLPPLKRKVLTSATHNVEIPDFVELQQPKVLDFLKEEKNLLKLQTVVAENKNKLDGLEKVLGHIGDGSGIIFCNYKDTIQFVSDFLHKKHISHAKFYGGLEQIDRERALIKFRNGTNRLLLATDLAARGIDVPELDFIIHFQLPFREPEFIHRNGRTARMHNNGVAYVLKDKNKDLPEFIVGSEVLEIETIEKPTSSDWSTLYISGGRKDKISKGDIAGLFFRQGDLKQGELGLIELKQECAYIAVPRAKASQLVETLNNSRLKKRKVRISILH